MYILYIAKVQNSGDNVSSMLNRINLTGIPEK
jgi:hypothetical protein